MSGTSLAMAEHEEKKAVTVALPETTFIVISAGRT
jgi:hypothetical protein